MVGLSAHASLEGTADCVANVSAGGRGGPRRIRFPGRGGGGVKVAYLGKREYD